MQTAIFYGASDDLIEVEGVKGGDEFNVISDDTCVAIFNVGGKMLVYALYGPMGVWGFGVSQIDDEVRLPDWPIRITNGEPDGMPATIYTTKLEIDVPDDAVVTRYQYEDN